MSYNRSLGYYERRNQIVLDRKRQDEAKLKAKPAPLFVFENISKSDHQLPHPSHDNKSWVKPGEKFIFNESYCHVEGISLVEPYKGEAPVAKSKCNSLFVFENITKADQRLPKSSHDRKTWIAPGERFIGDESFRCVKGIALIECHQQEETRMSEKLILDQPDTITNAGKVEHTIPDRNPKKDAKSESKGWEKQTLLVEDPIDGVDVILG